MGFIPWAHSSPPDICCLTFLQIKIAIGLNSIFRKLIGSDEPIEPTLTKALIIKIRGRMIRNYDTTLILFVSNALKIDRLIY